MLIILSRSSDLYETFTAGVLCALLMDGPASPLYKALIESGLGSTYSPQSGLWTIDAVVSCHRCLLPLVSLKLLAIKIIQKTIIF